VWGWSRAVHTEAIVAGVVDACWKVWLGTAAT
jgi:hypothetical protein